MAIVSKSRKFWPLSSDRRFAGWIDGVSWGYRPLIGVKPVSIWRVIPLFTLRDDEVLRVLSFGLLLTNATLHPRNCTFIGLVSPHGFHTDLHQKLTNQGNHNNFDHQYLKDKKSHHSSKKLRAMCKINKKWLLWDFGIFYQHNYLCPFAPLASWLAGIHCVARLKINALLAAAEFRSKPGKHLNWFLLLCWTS